MTDEGSDQRKLDVRKTRFLKVLTPLVVVVAALFLFLDWYIDPTKPSERNDLIITLAQNVGGAALLAGLYFTWRTLQVNREGQITERFTRAIEHLGNDKNEEIRLGGIYALERIAKDSADDYRSVMEILSTYVRHHAPDRAGKGSWGQRVDRAEIPPHAPDIQAIIAVIGRRQRRNEIEEDERPWFINLRDTDLRLVFIPDANLTHVNFAGADLRSALLSKADLRKANLFKADLAYAHLRGADLREANLREANLMGASLMGANLIGARGLAQKQLDQARGDTSTRLPGNVERPASWSKGRISRARETSP